MTPVLLRDIEEQIALKELVTTILFFSSGILLLTGLKEYINNATYQGKIEIRMSLCKAITEKIGATSYCNLGKKDFQEKKERTNQATNSNSSATEIIWIQLNQLLFCILGFLAYLFVMKRMNVLILAVTILAAVVSYLAAQRSVVWLQNNRAENDHARQCMWYLRGEAWSPVSAKDIRILHMKEWLLKTMKQNYEIFMHFERALGNHHFMADCVNIFSALIRNGVAYAYLIGQVLAGNMDAPQFILYFSAVSGFTSWVQGIMENVAQIRQSGVGISDVMELISYEEPYRFEDGEPLPKNAAGQYELRLENVSFRYPGASEDTLHNLNLTIQNGEKLAVVGRNGAGKSTLMNILAGNLVVDEGDILLEGNSIKNTSVRKRAKDIARVFQDPKMGTASRLTIEENMAIAQRRGKSRGLGWGVREKDRELFREALKELNIGLENRLKVDTQYLSGGQRQALTLVMAALVRPKLLLLDEHTAALDPKTSEMVMELTQKIVESHDLTTLMITHDMNHAIEYGNRLIMLYQGKIVVDVKGEEKKNLTVEDLMRLFQQNSGETLVSDELVLG